MEWLKTKLYGKKVTHNSVYYQTVPPNPKKGWLKKSALITGDLWFELPNKVGHVFSNGSWKKLETK